MQDVLLPPWAKREGGHEEEKRSTRRRKDTNQDQVLALTALLAQSHLQTERLTRENSGCLKVTALFQKSQYDEDWPTWVQEGLKATDTWFRSLKEGTQGSKGPGSPHVLTGTKTIHAILNTEMIKKPEHQSLRTRLTEWWTTKVMVAGKTENDLAEEIQVFRVEGPPTNQETNMRIDDSDNDTVDTVTKKNMPFAKIVFRLRGDQERQDLTSALRLLKAEIRHGPVPRSKATKELVKMLKDINKR